MNKAGPGHSDKAMLKMTKLTQMLPLLLHPQHQAQRRLIGASCTSRTHSLPHHGVFYRLNAAGRITHFSFGRASYGCWTAHMNKKKSLKKRGDLASSLFPFNTNYAFFFFVLGHLYALNQCVSTYTSDSFLRPITCLQLWTKLA